LREIVEELGVDMAKERQSADVGDFVPGEADVFEEVESLFETSSDEIVAMGWQVTDEQFEGGAGVKAILDIACRHGEFIEVGEKAGEKSAWEHVGQEIMPGERKEQSLGDGTTHRVRATVPSGHLVAEHDHRVADLQLRMHKQLAWTRHPGAFSRAKGLLVEFDSAFRAAHDQIRRNRVIPFRNCPILAGSAAICFLLSALAWRS